MQAQTLRSKLDFLARNLYWTWQPELGQIFRDLDPKLWREVDHNPVALLQRIDDATLEDRSETLSLQSRILQGVRRLSAYLDPRETWATWNAGLLNVRPVAYFSLEFGIHECLPLYSGGLGVLAGDHMKSSSDLGLPVLGIGILYTKGYFRQSLDASGWQKESYTEVDIQALPIERVNNVDGSPLTVEFLSGTESVAVAVWKVHVGRCELLLLDTDIEGNPEDYRDLTHRLYWGDNTTRIRQEMVLGIGGIRVIEALGITPGVYHLNEGHSAFALLEAVRLRMVENGLSFDDALLEVSPQSVFTTHTPVPAGHDRFPASLVGEHLGWLREELGLGEEEFLALGRVDPQDEDETFCMTVLALKLAKRTNGVSAIHGEVSRRMWQDLWPHRNLNDIPIGHITNGIHTPSWMGPTPTQYFERRIGAHWAEKLSDAHTWRRLREVDNGEVWETRQVSKSKLVNFVRRRVAAQEIARGVAAEEAARQVERLLDENVLTLGFARRFATYKRATLLLRDRDRLTRILADPERPVQILIAGKAHPRDEYGKHLIQDWAKLQKEEPFAGRVVFVENYDIDVGRHLVQGVDVWVNNPRKPEEACGTSGMKVAINGGLNLSVCDGWWAEAYDGLNGFAIDPPGPHTDTDIQDQRDWEALMQVLEDEVVPLYYDRDEDGLPHAWISRMRRSIMTLAWRFSADRMLMDYTNEAYLPAAGGLSARMPNGR